MWQAGLFHLWRLRDDPLVEAFIHAITFAYLLLYGGKISLRDPCQARRTLAVSASIASCCCPASILGDDKCNIGQDPQHLTRGLLSGSPSIPAVSVPKQGPSLMYPNLNIHAKRARLARQPRCQTQDTFAPMTSPAGLGIWLRLAVPRHDEAERPSNDQLPFSISGIAGRSWAASRISAAGV